MSIMMKLIYRATDDIKAEVTKTLEKVMTEEKVKAVTKEEA